MVEVAASEAALITIARAQVGAIEPAAAWPHLVEDRTLPASIGRDAADLLDETLARGAIRLLARGGARAGATVEGEKVKTGRLWERHPPPSLRFTERAYTLLRWLAATPLLGAPSTLPALDGAPVELGDQLLVWLAIERLEGPVRGALRIQPMVRATPLAWLGHAGELGSIGAPAAPVLDRLADLTAGTGAIVVEALAGALAERWRSTAAEQTRTVDPGALIAAGGACDAVLTAWFAACDRARRRDLAGFVLDAVGPLLPEAAWHAPDALDPTTPLSRRAEARRAAGSLWRALMRWEAWDREHRSIRYIDDGYRVAQHLLARFEPIGAPGVGRAVARLDELNALPASTISPP